MRLKIHPCFEAIPRGSTLIASRDFRSIIKPCKGIAFLFRASRSGGLPTGQDQRCFSFPGNAANARSWTILPNCHSTCFEGAGMGLGGAAQNAALPATICTAGQVLLHAFGLTQRTPTHSPQCSILCPHSFQGGDTEGPRFQKKTTIPQDLSLKLSPLQQHSSREDALVASLPLRGADRRG